MRAAVIAIAVGAVVAGPATATAQTPQVLRFHGGAYDSAAAIVADGSGNSYVGGFVESGEGASSFAVVKLGPDGATRWTARYNGSRGGVGGQANAVAVESGAPARRASSARSSSAPARSASARPRAST
jgi:hypothetical protein